MPGFIDFKELAERVGVEQVADNHRIVVKQSGKELRGFCIACNGDDPRSLCLYPETNSFRCFSAGISGDSIALHAHLNGWAMYAAAKDLANMFPDGGRATAPQKTEVRKQPNPPKLPEDIAKNMAADFDPAVFASKLTYSDEVAALGITEDDAERLSIGFCSRGYLRGRICFPVRHTNGQIAGFIGIGTDGSVKVPKQWLEPANIVQFKRPA